MSDTSTNTPTKPPIPATAQAKSKLKAFQFDASEQQRAQREDTTLPDTAPQPQAGIDEVATSDEKALRQSPNEQSPTDQTQHAASFPCTPGARLPLDDLIGNSDERKAEEPANGSPQEQIGWVPNSSTSPNRRKRKRAKSSSPTAPASSSQPHHFSSQRSLLGVTRTPAADPVTDLWQRYASSNQSGEGLKVPEVSNLIMQGSPRALETPVKGGGLRRWASTGNDWPNSRNKRRCTSSRASVNVWQEQTALETGNTSKVASMVQQLQATLTTQRQGLAEDTAAAAVTVASDCPSSSSPLPDIGSEAFAKPQIPSPLRARKSTMSAQSAITHGRCDDSSHAPNAHSLRPTQSGGIRFDTSRLVGDPLNPGAAPTYSLQNKAPLPAYKRPSITRVPSQPKVAPGIIAAAATTTTKDEFDDDDFDLSVDDLNELCSQAPTKPTSLYDIPQHLQPPAQLATMPSLQAGEVSQRHQHPATIIINDDDDEDEFGGGEIDEDSFAQAEINATQTLKVSHRFR